MASTRNKNTQGDYNAQQVAHHQFHSYYSYNQSHFYGVPQQSFFAGNGLLGMKTAHRNLSNNYCHEKHKTENLWHEISRKHQRNCRITTGLFGFYFLGKIESVYGCCINS
jgi:hypothetical protein